MPNWRSTRLAPWGICHVIGPVRDTVPRIRPTTSVPPAAPRLTLVVPGSGTDAAERQAGDDTNAKPAASTSASRRSESPSTAPPGPVDRWAHHPHPVAELEDEVVVGQQILVASAHPGDGRPSGTGPPRRACARPACGWRRRSGGSRARCGRGGAGRCAPPPRREEHADRGLRTEDDHGVAGHEALLGDRHRHRALVLDTTEAMPGKRPPSCARLGGRTRSCAVQLMRCSATAARGGGSSRDGSGNRRPNSRVVITSMAITAAG